MKRHSIIIFLAAALVFANSCKSNHDHEHASEQIEEKVSGDMVTLTKEQFAGIKVQLGTMEKKNLSSLVKASGVLDLPPQNKASISSLVGGIITKIHVIQGDHVKKGQVLAFLEHPDILRLQQDYLEAKNNYEFAEKEYHRQKELYDERIVSGKKFQSVEADYKSQRGLLSSLESQLVQVGLSPSSVAKGNIVKTISIKSPMDGYIHKIQVNTGSYVEPAKEIFMIVDNHHIHIDLQVFEKDISKVKQGQKVFFTLSNIPDVQYEAKIFAVGKAFETETRSVAVHADIQGNKNINLLPGMYVDGRIQVDNHLVNAVPDEAVISQGGFNYIFMVADSASENKDLYTFKKIPVQTGISDLGYTEITSLAKLNDSVQIVIKGAYYLQAQMKQGEETGDEHGH